MSAEYIAASDGMRSLLFLRRVHHDICTTLSLPFDPVSNTSVVWEDNQACLSLATPDPSRMTPRSTSIAVKYHWFRDHLITGEIAMRHISSTLQRGNIFTKSLPKTQFEAERFVLMGF